jgi:hypothetical protein
MNNCFQSGRAHKNGFAIAIGTGEGHNPVGRMITIRRQAEGISRVCSIHEIRALRILFFHPDGGIGQGQAILSENENFMMKHPLGIFCRSKGELGTPVHHE